VFSGFWNLTGAFNVFMGEGETHSLIHGLFGVLAQPLPWISMAFAGLGILLAWAMYIKMAISAEKVGRLFGPFYRWAFNKWYFDELYENIIVRKFLMGGLFNIMQWFDTNVIDGTVNGIGTLTSGTGRLLRRWQTGRVQLYALFMGIGAVATILVVLLSG